jgi:L-iditol 2-dehydrogenase
MKASVLCDVGRLEVRELPVPAFGPRDLLLRVRAVGLCGTDFHIFEGHANYNTDSRGKPVPLREQPQVLGHEIAGVVEAAGPEVSDLKAGDRVIIDQGLNCFSAGRSPVCEYCGTGHSHQCAHYRELGITGLQGGLAEYVAIPAVNAIRLETNLELLEAALTEPLGCIVHSCDMVARASSRYRLGEKGAGSIGRVLICGAGPAGLLFARYLRNVLGYDRQLIVAEPNAKRRSLAALSGAELIDPSEDDLVEAVDELTGGSRADWLIEATGSSEVFSRIPGLIRKQATVLLYGHGHAGKDLSVLNGVMFLEPALVASVGASGDFDSDGRPLTYRRALTLIEEGRIEVGDFITHRYESLDELPRAFAGEHRDAGYVKGVATI